MTNQRVSEFARMSSQLPRVEQQYGAYYRPTDVGLDEELTRVARGTVGGEYLRRTWQPVCLSSEVDELPKNVRMLGEELVVFRTRRGEAAVRRIPSIQLM